MTTVTPEDPLTLELIMHVAALRRSLDQLQLPVPQIVLPEPDLSAIVTAVTSLKPSVTADEIGKAVAANLQIPGPPASAAETATVMNELTEVLKKLEFRMRGAGPAYGASGPANISDNPNRLLGHVTVDSMPAGSGTTDVTDRVARLLGVVDKITNALPAGSNLIGHVVSDTGSVTDVQDRSGRLLGHVTVDSLPTVTVAEPASAGTPVYASGASGTVTVPAGKQVKSITCHATTAGSLTIFGGTSIPVPANATFFDSMVAEEDGNWVGDGTSSIVFTGTDSYFVRYV